MISEEFILGKFTLYVTVDLLFSLCQVRMYSVRLYSVFGRNPAAPHLKSLIMCALLVYVVISAAAQL